MIITITINKIININLVLVLESNARYCNVNDIVNVVYFNVPQHLQHTQKRERESVCVCVCLCVCVCV